MSEKFRQRLYNKISTISFVIQRLRIWSRMGLILYLVFLHQLVFWVFGLPDITTTQAIIVSVITALASPITAFYVKSGKDLYEDYVSMTYSNKWIERIDHIGFVIDKLRLFPLCMLIYYGFLLYMSINWGLSLGSELTMSQVAFISTFSGSASLVFGFFVSTGEVNMKIEEAYVKRNKLKHTNDNREVDIDQVMDDYKQQLKEYEKGRS